MSPRPKPDQPSVLPPGLQNAMQSYMAPIEDAGFTVSVMKALPDQAAKQAVNYADLPLFETARPSGWRRVALTLSLGGAAVVILTRIGRIIPFETANITVPEASFNWSLLTQPSALLGLGLLGVVGLMVLLFDANSAY